MNTAGRIAFGCYLLIALAFVGIGLRYVFASEILSYHLTALGVSTWDQLAPNIAERALSYMKSAGNGFLAAGCALAFLLVPLRRDEDWAKWGLLTVSLIQIVFIGIQVMRVRSGTAAEPPIIPLIALFGLSIIGFLTAFRAKASD